MAAGVMSLLDVAGYAVGIPGVPRGGRAKMREPQIRFHMPPEADELNEDELAIVLAALSEC